MTLTLAHEFEVHVCPLKDCGVTYALTETFGDKRRNDQAAFYCPNGHRLSYPKSASDAVKLGKAETALRAKDDQLRAAIREGDLARQETLRIRQRIANGVCPCCTRSFGDLRRHMSTQHPDYAVPGDWKHQASPFRCSCGHKFETFRGLRVHQGQMRDDGWDKPETTSYWSHLTVV